MSTVCDTHGPYHFFAIPTGERGFGRKCACGTPQVYRPPTGEPAKFTDVLVEAEDLRHVLEQAVELLEIHGFGACDDEVVMRLLDLLD